jgi:putative PEP-CTERM system TPR-repeat lipoprotein
MTKHTRHIIRALPVLLALGALPASGFADTYSDSAQQLIDQGDLKGAAIQLRNAAHDQPQNADIHLRLATIYLNLGNIPAAEAEVRNAIAQGADEAKTAPMLGQVLLRSDKFTQVLSEVPAGNRPAASESAVRLARGLAYLGLHQVADAAPMLQDAERLNPGAADPKLGIARLLLAQNSAANAESKVDAALQLEPHNDRALILKAEIMRQRGDLDGAIARYADILSREPQNVQALLGRANIEIAKNNANGAQADINAATAQIPDNPEAAYLLALLNARQGNFAKANDILQKYSVQLGDFPAAILLTGVAEFSQNQLSEAQSNLARFAARVPNSPLATRLLGDIALRQGHPNQAIAALEPLTQTYPNDAAAWAILADAYAASGDNAKASNAIDRASSLGSTDLKLDTELAVTRLNVGQADLALQQLEQVFQTTGGAEVAGPALVISDLRTHRVDDADKTAELLVKQRPNDLVVQNLLGLVRVAQADLVGAERIFSGLYTQHPEFTVAGLNLAQVYLGEGRPEDSLATYRAIIAREETNVGIRMAMANVLTAMQRYDEAVATLQRASAIDPANPAPGLQIANIYATQKNWQKAVDTMRPMVQQFPNNLDVLDMMGRIQLATKDTAGAQATYHRATTVSSTSAVMYDRYAGALAASGNWNAARDAMRHAVALAPGNPGFKEGLIEAEYKIGGTAGAMAAAQALISTGDNPALPASWTASALARDGKIADAQALLTQAARANPSEAVTVQLAVMTAGTGDTAKAIALLKAWTDSNPGNLAAMQALADLYLNTGDYASAEAMFQGIQAKAPDNAVVLNNLAWLYQRRGDSRAIGLARQAYRLAPLAPSVADTYGWVLLSSGDVDHAVPPLRMANYAMPDDPAVQYHLAVALSKTGNTAGARELLEKSVANPAAFDGKQQASDMLHGLTGKIN